MPSNPTIELRENGKRKKWTPNSKRIAPHWRSNWMIWRTTNLLKSPIFTRNFPFYRKHDKKFYLSSADWKLKNKNTQNHRYSLHNKKKLGHCFSVLKKSSLCYESNSIQNRLDWILFGIYLKIEWMTRPTFVAICCVRPCWAYHLWVSHATALV